MVVCLATVLFSITGCGKGKGSDPAQLAKLFQSADPQTKADWDKASAAAETNDFVTAILTLKKLQEQPGLTPEQRTAVNDSMTAANDQLSAAVQKGDPNATKALEEIRRRWRSG